jgi:hypothetical protein
MDKLNSTKFKENVHRLLKMDYTVGLYNYNENIIQISFNHLNSVYNALAFIDLKSGKIFFEWNYSRKNKTVENIIIKILEYMKTYYYLKKDLLWIESELLYFKNLAQKIYNCKYALNIEMHTLNA